MRQIELVDKDIDRAYRIIFANPIFQALRKQRALLTIRALNEALHPMLPRISARESHNTAFSHSQERKLARTDASTDGGSAPGRQHQRHAPEIRILRCRDQ